MGQELPLVTIVISSKEDEPRIDACLACVLAQDYPNEKLEIVVVDAMSMDATREKILRVAAEDSRVRLVDNPERTRGAALNAALRVRPELPYACRGGVCSTCRARLVSGEVTMASNYALEPADVAAGYVLTCQSSPVTEKLEIDYDA